MPPERRKFIQDVSVTDLSCVGSVTDVSSSARRRLPHGRADGRPGAPALGAAHPAHRHPDPAIAPFYRVRGTPARPWVRQADDEPARRVGGEAGLGVGSERCRTGMDGGRQSPGSTCTCGYAVYVVDMVAAGVCERGSSRAGGSQACTVNVGVRTVNASGSDR
jgi:hypothetical protein